MPVASPDVSPKVQRAIPLVPAIIALLAVIAAFIVAVVHFTTKKPAPQLNSSAAEIATGRVPETRDPYTPSDVTEPDLK